MIIKIHQVLHGYKEGHQLLASSVDLSVEARKALLFQSDLSGPTIYKGFETYLTGYQVPDSKYYAFAKTWYANEMPRPGCVWTHTLLVELVDVGKIVEFESLMRFFKRPEQNIYQEYSDPFGVKLDTLELTSTCNLNYYDVIATAIYDFPTQPIIISAETAETFQREVLQIWSDQWPRLRRSFSFCTGAMSPKFIRGKAYDLLIVPSIISLRQFEGSMLIKPSGNEELKTDWLSTIHKYNKHDLRQFFWIFGADIDGNRANYTKLLSLYKLFTEELSLVKIGDAIRKNIPNPNDGKSIKQFLFNSTKLANFSEYEILTYLTATEDLRYLPLSEYNITERLAKAVNEEKITFYDCCRLLLSAQPERISDEIWDLVEYNFADAIRAIELSEVNSDKILARNPDYFGKTAIWQYNSRTSEFAFKWVVKNFPHGLPKKYLNAVLNADYRISLQMLDNYREGIVPDILFWSLESSKKIPNLVAERIAKQYRQSLIAWVTPRIGNVPIDILVLLFDYGTARQAFELPFNTGEWLEILNRLDKNRPAVLPTVYTIVLSIGFNNEIQKSELLVTRSFGTVFNLAAQSQLVEIWELLPQDLDGFDEEEEEFSIFDTLLKLFRINPSKKRYQIPNWDHCELLVVTYIHRFLKSNWSLQGFVHGLSSKAAFERAIAYLVTFKRGREQITTIIHNMNAGKIHCHDFQRNILTAIKNQIQ